MRNNIFISIIIPVYNVEKYISECLNSILERQNFHDFEVLLIDDGSTDSSSDICDKYSEGDHRVKVIHKDNGGASAARNEGIKRAEGKYILFIDSDDYIKDGSMEKIASAVSHDGEADLFFLNSSTVYPDGTIKLHTKFEKEDFFMKSHREVLSNIANGLPDCVWGKLIKRDIIIQNDIYFTENIICEDVDFMIKLFLHAKTYNVIDYDFYYYREGREGSVMNVRSIRMFTDLLYIITKWTELAESTYREYASVINNWSLRNFWILLPRYRGLSYKAKKEYKEKVHKLTWLLNCSNDNIIKLLRFCNRLFGLSCISWITTIYCLFHHKKSR